MNRALASCIVNCLRGPVPSDQTLQQLSRFGRRDWEQTLYWLHGSGLIHYYLRRICDVRAERLLPAKVLETLQRNFAANQQRVPVMAREFDDLNDRLSDASLAFAAVRGFDLFPDYCSDLSMRTWYCHEYLVPAETLSRARAVVEKAGFPFRRTGSRGELCFADNAMQPPAQVEKVYEDTFPRMVILHHQFWDSAQTNVEVPKSGPLLEKLSPRGWGNILFPTLPDAAELEFAVLDTFVRVLNYWCKPSWFFEMAHFLQSTLAHGNFWKTFYNRIEGRGRLMEVSGIVFGLACRLFNPDVAPAVRDHLARIPASLNSWVENYGRRWALSTFPGSKLSLFLQTELVCDSSTWKRVRRHCLFPFPAAHHPVAGEGAAMEPRTNGARRDWSRVLQRLRFHGTTTLEYVCELPRWKSSRGMHA